MNHSLAPSCFRLLRYILLGTFLTFGLHGTALGADEVFEGRVEMKLSENGGTAQTIDYYVKGERMRIETDDARAQGGTMILNMADKEILMLMPSQKVYMSMPLPDLGTGGPDTAAPTESPEPEPTGETRTILGHEAHQYIVRDKDTEFEVWATDELGTFGALRLPDQRNAAALSPARRALANQKFFPLLIIERKNGKETSRVEVTDVEKMSLEASLFEPPADFREMKMPFQAPQ